jgi:hypothetical protein
MSILEDYQLAKTPIALDVTVKVTDISAIPAGVLARRADSFLICDRCHDADEIVVALMEILPLEGRWALCGPCSQEMPRGFHVA